MYIAEFVMSSCRATLSVIIIFIILLLFNNILKHGIKWQLPGEKGKQDKERFI